MDNVLKLASLAKRKKKKREKPKEARTNKDILVPLHDVLRE